MLKHMYIHTYAYIHRCISTCPTEYKVQPRNVDQCNRELLVFTSELTSRPVSETHLLIITHVLQFYTSKIRLTGKANVLDLVTLQLVDKKKKSGRAYHKLIATPDIEEALSYKHAD